MCIGLPAEAIDHLPLGLAVEGEPTKLSHIGDVAWVLGKEVELNLGIIAR